EREVVGPLSLQEVLMLLWSPSSGVSAGTTVTGHRGQSVQIRYAPIGLYKTSIKYLCRGECSALWRTKVIPVQSGSAEDQTFSLDDDTAARVFTITINDLRAEDRGRYWCRVKRPKPLPDLYTEILLLVEQGENLNIQISKPHPGPSPNPHPGPSPNPNLYLKPKLQKFFYVFSVLPVAWFSVAAVLRGII
uniref:Immunoglobulin V-set domain-containing protein n=1 Tax=Pygocentrus nattereri TaxID=42514 RepID=A0A3B4C9R2_PYGNA